MITTLKPSFNEGKTKFVEKEEKYYIELTFEAMEKKKNKYNTIYKIWAKDPLAELDDKINTIENECNNLSKEIEQLKYMKDNDKDIKEKIIGILQENDIKMKLFEEFEKIIFSKYNLDNNKNKDEKNKINFNEKLKSIEEKLIEK